MRSQTDKEDLFITRVDASIDYYWKSSRSNKLCYKTVRISMIALGALVTLFSSISSAGFVQDHPGVALTFAIITPLLAALLTIANSLSQTFSWGAAWRDMVMNAQSLEAIRDSYLCLSPEKRNPCKALKKVHTLIVQETRGFFFRLVSGEKGEPENPVEPGDNLE